VERTSSSVIGLLLLVQLNRENEIKRMNAEKKFFKILLLAIYCYGKFTKEGENKLKIF
jgi:hypothetical protein